MLRYIHVLPNSEGALDMVRDRWVYRIVNWHSFGTFHWAIEFYVFYGRWRGGDIEFAG